MDYEELGAEIGALVATKQAAYGNSFGRSGAILKILYPTGIRPDQFDAVLTLVRIVDKLFRIAIDKDALGESPYGDIAGYALLGLAQHRQEKANAALVHKIASEDNMNLMKGL